MSSPSFSDKLEYVLATSHHGKCPVYYIQPETQQPGECRCRLRGAKEAIIKLVDELVNDCPELSLTDIERFEFYNKTEMPVISKTELRKKLRGES